MANDLDDIKDLSTIEYPKIIGVCVTLSQYKKLKYLKKVKKKDVPSELKKLVDAWLSEIPFDQFDDFEDFAV